jgi:phage/plasmid-associated DNA primase
MNTCVFLKSGEGTGKSVILEFIINHVIGQDLGLISGRASQLSSFNYQLLGKLLVILEELPTQSKNEWFSLSDILKQIITGSSLEIEKKHQDMITTANYISLYVITNNDNTIEFGKDARRYFMADIKIPGRRRSEEKHI